MARAPTVTFVDATGDILVQTPKAIAQLIENLCLRLVLRLHRCHAIVTDEIGIFQRAQPT